MIRPDSSESLTLKEFEGPFQPVMEETNRWVRLSQCIPWSELARVYETQLSATQGRPAKPARLVIGAMIIKHKLSLSDRETVCQIQENPYLQYFVGLSGYQAKQPFAPSLFVEIRKRMGQEVFDGFQQAIVNALQSSGAKPGSDTDSASSTLPAGTTEASDGPSQHDPAVLPETAPSQVSETDQPEVASASASAGQAETAAPSVAAAHPATPDQGLVPGQTNLVKTHQGKLILDATVAPQAIRYPTDLNLLNEARERTEQIIDGLYPHTDLNKKPRTYRQVARRAYLSIVKQKRPGAKRLRRGIRQQLQFLRRNLGHISRLQAHFPTRPEGKLPLPGWLQDRYSVIQHLYQQQRGMYQNRTRRCDDRIVSLSQPYVRPIVRGKVNKPVEFGAKLSVSLTDEGIAQVDHLSWDAFHESRDLRPQVEAHYQRYQVYPEVVIADPAYGTRDNRRYLKSLGIRFSGKPLGRPRKVNEENQAELQRLKAQRRDEYLQRIPIEGKFGQGKNGYSLSYIRAKRADTSVAWINAIFFVMNLLVLWRFFWGLSKSHRFRANIGLFCLVSWLTIRCKSCAKQPI